MRWFSNRNRPVPLGPLPAERLPRRDLSADDGRHRLPALPVGRPAVGSFAEVLAPVIDVFTTCRVAEVAPGTAPVTSVQVGADNVRGYCFFLDADLVGVCQLKPAHWTGAASAGHTHALAVVVGSGRPSRPGEPGHGWIGGCEVVAADLRAMEIATVVARYLGTLGHAATAHSAHAGEVDRARVAVDAGVLEVRGGRLTHPLLAGAPSVAVVTTSLAMPTDRPLATRSVTQRATLGLRHALGIGGTRPGLARLDGRHRPWHLGRYPMERIKRVDEPTTLIRPDEVPRVPARHNFFMRARAGDLGPRAQHEVGRFIEKAPHGLATRDLLNRLVPLQDSEPAGPASAGDPATDAAALKALAHFLGADMAGVCAVPEYAWYSHEPDGTPINADHANALVIVLDQGHETMAGASGDDWISGAQSMRAYLRASIITCVIAAHLRRLGWPARAHTAAYDQVNHLPLLLQAGIGELSRIGELVLNPFVGPRFKSGVVTTDMALQADRPIDFGLQDFCSHCTKCARECPVGAIRGGEPVMFNGYQMWKPDVDRCARYRITNMRGSACGRCMKTCPWNTEGVLTEAPFRWAAIHLPATRPWLARLDDRVRRGAINPVKRWWLDIELIDDVPVAPPRGANRRSLEPDRAPRAEDGFALFPPEISPPPTAGMVRHPLDREAGIAAARRAERRSASETPRQRRG